MTTGKQQWGDSIWINLVPGNGLTYTFAKTSQCAHQTFFLEHIECVYDFKQKYFWWKCDSCYKTLVVSQNLFTKWHASDFYKINFSSISEYQLFTDSLYRAVCFETFRCWERLVQPRNPVKKNSLNSIWSQAVFTLNNGEPLVIYNRFDEVTKTLSSGPVVPKLKTVAAAVAGCWCSKDS